MIQGCFEPAPDRSSRKASLAFGARLARAAAPPEQQDPFAFFRRGMHPVDRRVAPGARANGPITRAHVVQADGASCPSSPWQGPIGRHSHEKGDRDAAK
jgi:hypothetical protein